MRTTKIVTVPDQVAMLRMSSIRGVESHLHIGLATELWTSRGAGTSLP
jgi:hypothetical protein